MGNYTGVYTYRQFLRVINNYSTMKANLESKILTPPLESQRALMEHLALFELIEELIELLKSSNKK